MYSTNTAWAFGRAISGRILGGCSSTPVDSNTTLAVFPETFNTSSANRGTEATALAHAIPYLFEFLTYFDRDASRPTVSNFTDTTCTTDAESATPNDLVNSNSAAHEVNVALALWELLDTDSNFTSVSLADTSSLGVKAFFDGLLGWRLFTGGFQGASDEAFIIESVTQPPELV